MMKKIVYVILVILLIVFSGFVGWFIGQSEEEQVISITKNLPIPKPLAIYSIDNLSNTNIDPGSIMIKETIKEDDNFNSYLFELIFEPNPEKNELKKTTGLINIPTSGENLPVVLMLRGYVDQEIYETGMGTKNSAEFFANNGFITIAPDFLGYADSDEEAGNIFESRFQTYTTVLSILKTLEELKKNPKLIQTSGQQSLRPPNFSSIHIWGHSNGGQIALTILEITKSKYPTTLWAPVSKPFPYSILYYTDESADRGKLIRAELAKFEDLYDTDKYSLTEYFDRIEAPIQIQQGTLDDAVPKNWSDSLVGYLESLEKEVEYLVYSGADHNLRPSWNDAVSKDLDFFTSFGQY